MVRYNQPRHPILVQYLSIIPYTKFEAALTVGLDIADQQHPASAATMPRGFERYQNGIDAIAAATVEVDSQVVPGGSTSAH